MDDRQRVRAVLEDILTSYQRLQNRSHDKLCKQLARFILEIDPAACFKTEAESVRLRQGIARNFNGAPSQTLAELLEPYHTPEG